MTASTTGTDVTGSGINSGGQHVCSPSANCIGCLAASALATELTADQLHALFKITEVRKLSKNEILISEGEYDDRLYAIAKGELEISRNGARGQETLGRFGPARITGELAFLEGLERTATVKAATDECCVIALRRHDLESLLSIDPWLVYQVMRAIVRSAHGTVNKMDSTYSELMHYISG